MYLDVYDHRFRHPDRELYDGSGIPVGSNLYIEMLSTTGTIDSPYGALVCDYNLGQFSLEGTGFAHPGINTYLAGDQGVSMPAGYDGVVFRVQDTPYFAGSWIIDILYESIAPGDATIGFYDISDTWSVSGPAVDEIYVHQIPEPATLSLLGVGILGFLRRKHKNQTNCLV